MQESIIFGNDHDQKQDSGFALFQVVGEEKMYVNQNTSLILREKRVSVNII